MNLDTQIMNKIYTIYHIPDYVYKDGSVGKIGVTHKLKDRLYSNKRSSLQGFTNWEVLEEHTCKYKVSDREIEFQKEYGYKVDCIPYWRSLKLGLKPRVYKSHLAKLHKANKKCVLAYHKDSNEFIGEFESAVYTAKVLNCSSTKVSEVCNGRRMHTKGFVFKYK